MREAIAYRANEYLQPVVTGDEPRSDSHDSRDTGEGIT